VKWVSPSAAWKDPSRHRVSFHAIANLSTGRRNVYRSLLVKANQGLSGLPLTPGLPVLQTAFITIL
jgi:hypothetical protein